MAFDDDAHVYIEVGDPPNTFKLKRSDTRLIEGLKRRLVDGSEETTIELPGVNIKTFRILVWFLVDRVIELTETQEVNKLLQLADLWTVAKHLKVQSIASKILEKWRNEFPSMQDLQHDFLRAAARIYWNETADVTFRTFFRRIVSDNLASDDWTSKRLTDYLRAGGRMAEDLYEAQSRVAEQQASKLKDERRRAAELEAQVTALKDELRRLKGGTTNRTEPAREAKRGDERGRSDRRDAERQDGDRRDDRRRPRSQSPDRRDITRPSDRRLPAEVRTAVDKLAEFLKDI